MHKQIKDREGERGKRDFQGVFWTQKGYDEWFRGGGLNPIIM